MSCLHMTFVETLHERFSSIYFLLCDKLYNIFLFNYTLSNYISFPMHNCFFRYLFAQVFTNYYYNLKLKWTFVSPTRFESIFLFYSTWIVTNQNCYTLMKHVPKYKNTLLNIIFTCTESMNKYEFKSFVRFVVFDSL